MSPVLTFALSLMASVVLATPTLMSFLRGDIGADMAALRYLVAFGVARVGVGFVGRLLVTYVTQMHLTAARRAMEEVTE